MRRRAAFGALLLALPLGAGCGDFRDGEAVSLEGNVVRGIECPLLLDTADGRFAVLGDVRALREGERIRVSGRFTEYSACLLGGIRASSIVSVPPEKEVRDE